MSIAVLSIVISLLAIVVSVANMLLVRATERRIRANLQRQVFDAAGAEEPHDGWLYSTDVRKFPASA